ncbi:threonine/serine dehydratase [Lentzea sp. BCCO 10_0856]|uniref:Threonine/serine dehydratase n=1 Tax=Lentzea miocenica TaxID=3095431 RepID=A0ABU4T5N2_9PSEU|nr:threonine/serine dehydratase [Lentzea sp. BCCO 10_0856]MDX8033430.1 threonine/serine dehydratase [Lentzea sp. BCCO 10_0856]
MAELLTIDDVRAAAEVIDGRVLRTPTLPSPGLSALLGVPTTVKLELLQRSGSFKTRGAFAKILSLSGEARAAGVVGVSGGNHGIALANAAQELGVAATVVMPSSAPARSVDMARASGADVRLTNDLPSAFALLNDLVAAGATLVHPYDDPTVVAGQGTVGLEFATDAPHLTDVLVSIGGGGFIAGVATAFHALVPGVRVWGVEVEGADAMHQALAAGGPVEITPTSIVSTLSAPHVSQLTYDHAVALLEDVLVVSDAEAVQGSITLAEKQKVWAEPAAGCLVAAARTVLEQTGPDVRLGIVVCGGNATVADVVRWSNG